MEERQNGAHIKVRMDKLLPVSLSCSCKIQMPVFKPVLQVFSVSSVEVFLVLRQQRKSFDKDSVFVISFS